MKSNEALGILKQELDEELFEALEAKWQSNGTFEIWTQELFYNELKNLYNMCKGQLDSSEKPLNYIDSLELSYIKEFYLLNSIVDILNQQEFNFVKPDLHMSSLFNYPTFYDRWQALFDRLYYLKEALFDSCNFLWDDFKRQFNFIGDELTNYSDKYSSYNNRFNILYIKDFLKDEDAPSSRLKYLVEIKSDYISSNNITDEQKKEDEFLIKLNSEINRNKELLELELKTPSRPIQTSSRYYLNDDNLSKIDFIRIFYAILKLGGFKHKNAERIVVQRFMNDVGDYFNIDTKDYNQKISNAFNPSRQNEESNTKVFDELKKIMINKFQERYNKD